MKNLFLLALLVMLALSSYGQIRHVRGIKSIEAGYGISKFGALYYGSFVKYYNTKLYGKFSGFYEQGADAGIRFTSTGLDGQAVYNFLKIGEGIYVNGLAGITMALDQLQQGAEEFTIDPTFKYGVFAGIENEIFISDKFVLVLGCSQRFVFAENFGNNRFYAYSGIRFNIKN